MVSLLTTQDPSSHFYSKTRQNFRWDPSNLSKIGRGVIFVEV